MTRQDLHLPTHMAPREFKYQWEWRLKSSPEELWPLISDTNRFNSDTGVPSIQARPTDGKALGNARRRLRLFRFGVPVEWEEEPFEWVRPYRYGVLRRYSRGPVGEMRVLAEVTRQPDGSRLVYQVWAKPRNVLGLAAIPVQIGVWSARAFDAAFRRYDRAAVKHKPSPHALPAARVDFAPGGRERLANYRRALLDGGAQVGLVDLLCELIATADDLALFRLRPYALADFWEKPRRDVLDLCLWATRVGLLNFQWDLLCPLCRGARQSSASLGGISARVHCESCNIDFNVNFDRSVEITFHPNPSVRPNVPSLFCVGGPQLTPHIVAQQLLQPGETRDLSVTLERGRYRLRAMELPGGQLLTAAEGAGGSGTLRAAPGGWPSDELQFGLNPTLHLENATGAEQLLILERMVWSDQAVTAAEVTTTQLFRDLFANEALRPGEHITVGSLTILFTDLRNSTRLYREAGDAVAFGRVMDHFDVLKKAVDAEQGAIVKTIGDSVMAAFLRPISAVRAVLRAQSMLQNSSELTRHLRLKAGINSGPCVAVTLNDRLDYFGSTVNLAARLEGLSADRESFVVSSVVRHDPEVAEWIAGGGLSVERFEAALKGFEGERFELWAVAARSQ